MKALHHLTKHEASGLQGLLFDLDDTVLDDGLLTEQAYSSLFRLKESGLQLIALTGRPASWAELVARMWPVSAAIAENGALAYQSTAQGPVLIDAAGAETRQHRAERLKALVEQARAELPELVVANDVKGRISDFTFDIGEHHQAEEHTIARAIEIARAAGARTTRSSVHLHFTYDFCDKASGAIAYLASQGVDATLARQTFAFVGDSENDAPCFSAFRTSFGVANLSGRFSLLPAFQTKNSRGAGFSELASTLKQLRKS